jgi:hypothetical protein
MELKKILKAEYIGESRDGNTTLRMDVWLADAKNCKRMKVSFFLEDKRTSKQR